MFVWVRVPLVSQIKLLIPIKWTNIDDASMIEYENEAKELLYNLIVNYNRCQYDCSDII